MSTEPQLVRPEAPAERNWLPLAVAAAIVLAVVAGLVLVYGRGKNQPQATPINAAADPYAANLVIGNLAMSESGNLVGSKVTYIDGHIANAGNRTVRAITVQVLFRNVVHEVAQNETLPLKIIRTRVPYIDVEPLSASPLKPGAAADFRLVFDTVDQSWDGAYPEIRIIRVETR